MAYRRGFKTEANDIAREIRQELKLGSIDPLNPWLLAKHLDIEIIKMSDLGDQAPSAVRLFGVTHTSAFSAVTVFRGMERTIMHNDSHTPGRQASDIAHEEAHSLLLHPPTPAINAHGCRNWNQDHEDEASWLGAVLLVPEAVTLHVVRQGIPLDAAAEQYGVSIELMRWRINMTGAHRRVRRGSPSGLSMSRRAGTRS